MTDNTESLVLEHLRAIREVLNKHTSRFDGVDRRLLSIETHMAAFHNSTAHQEEELAALKSRVERIERRLNLTDEQQ